jgi:4-(gamma-glutamylamino)butanal dehydrogenase
MTETAIPSIDESHAAVAGLRLNTQLFIDGSFRDAADGARFGTVNPATGGLLADVARGGAADVDGAVAAARRAADDGRWSRLDPRQREVPRRPLTNSWQVSVDAPR